MIPTYPKWICAGCGAKHGQRKPDSSHRVDGTCQLCGNDKPVVPPSAYGGLKPGWDIEDALKIPPLKDCKRKPFVLDGIEYKTLRGCARSLKVNTEFVKKMIESGRGHYL